MLIFFVSLILGWFGALFVNYLSDVLPFTRKFSNPLCSTCQNRLTPQYYFVHGPCLQCGAKPSNRHWIVGLLGPFLAGLMAYNPPPNLGLWGGLIWLIFFGLVVVIDLEHRLILHPVSLIGAGLGLIFGSISHGILNTLIGGAAGFGIMLVFYLLGNLFIKVLSRSRGEVIEEVALGFGDVNLAGIIGLLLGWPGVIAGIFVAIILGGIVSGIFLVVQLFRKKYQAYQALPYGPFLVLSVILLLYSSQYM